MAGIPFANLKNGAKKFIEIIDEATDGTKNREICVGKGAEIQPPYPIYDASTFFPFLTSGMPLS